jgi:hypothetical protein
MLQDRSTSHWLRDPLDVAIDAEYFAVLFAKRAQKSRRGSDLGDCSAGGFERVTWRSPALRGFIAQQG